MVKLSLSMVGNCQVPSWVSGSVLPFVRSQPSGYDVLAFLCLSMCSHLGTKPKESKSVNDILKVDFVLTFLCKSVVMVLSLSILFYIFLISLDYLFPLFFAVLSFIYLYLIIKLVKNQKSHRLFKKEKTIICLSIL